jgi:hypothetical protein
VRFAFVSLIATLLLAAPAGATTDEQAVSLLNQQRKANGIPSQLTTDSYRSGGCHHHNIYMEHNGLQHGEDPLNPWSTPDGADYSGSGEVLAQGSVAGWSPSSNPWDEAPLHQTLLFDPSVNTAGYDEYQSFFCMRFGFGVAGPAGPSFYAYTGNLGRTAVPFREDVEGEGPYAPQEAVGIPQGVPTGPNILFFTAGFGSSNHAALYALTDSAGRGVKVKFVDSTTPPPPKGNGYRAFTTGGDMIPVDPLLPATSYTAKVLWHNDDSGANQAQSVAFTTAGRERKLALSLSRKLSRSGRATLTAPVAAVGQRASVRIQVAAKGASLKTVSSKRVVLKRSQAIKVPRPSTGGRAAMRVTLRPFALGSTRYDTPAVLRTYR